MTLLIWAGFILAVLVLLALDLGVFNRRPHEITVGEALGWSGFWVLLALAFNVLVYWLYENNWMGAGLAFSPDIDGRTAAIEFLTGYVLEKSLSLDNIFVIALIFSYFRVPLAYQHRVLFWGVIGALALRGVMIAAGAALIENFAWMNYVFGALLLISAARMLVARHDNLDAEENVVVRTARRWIPITEEYDGARFFVMRGGVRMATPLFLVLLMVETTDAVFAVDSIPAIFAVTDQPFIVYTSNVFAVLGLRSLYFALAPMIAKFRFLKASLVFVLAYIGVKMILTHHHPIPGTVSLAIVAGILGVGVLASVIGATRDTAPLRAPMGLRQLADMTSRQVWKALVLLTGGTVLLMGAAMIVLPGPALLVVPAGLAILASQFMWARRWLDGLKHRLDELGDDVEGEWDAWRGRRGRDPRDDHER